MRFVILGGGPAGYAAAGTAAALGAQVTLIERRGLGGNCTLTDAIPSKTLLHTASVMATVEGAERIGVRFEHGRPTVDLLATIAHARWLAAHQAGSIRQRLDTSEAEVVYGEGRVAEDGVLEVETEDGVRALQYDHLLIATGASPWEPPFASVDRDRVFTTRQVLDMQAFPEHLLVVGAGATGCEYAEFFQSCGVRCTLFSPRAQILPQEDRDMADIVQEEFLLRGMEIVLRARVNSIDVQDDGVCLKAEDGRTFTGSHALICMGMRAEIAGLGLEGVGVETSARGEIVVDEQCRTSNPNISAGGDVTGGWMLASTAAMQGRIAVLSVLGHTIQGLSLDAIAGTVFTSPEVADVGLTESKAANAKRLVAVTRHDMRNNPRGVIAGQSNGMIKLIWDPESGVVLGGSIVGYRASELIAIVALAVKAGLTVDDLAQTGAVNPSMSESVQRCAERAANDRVARVGSQVTL
jgi:pyruvate/2-oxoglutarate dehydrogenase complex dihydrolipoamide dehydrogenase (E3) component